MEICTMFENWEEQVRNACRITENDHILLAVSGGVDSMVMLELFARSSFKFGIAHCNFKLRGKDSFADEQLVRETAGRLGAEFHFIRFNTMAYANKRHISMEMAARTLRYSWFKEITDSFGYTHVATAHHREDAEETFLLNLGRGTGIRELYGIPPTSGNIIRPMRYFSKNDIIGFASEQGVAYREDATNNEDICQRNIVRHHILPELRKLNPYFDSNMDKSMRILHAQGSIYFNHIKEVASQLLKPEEYGYSISLERVAKLPFPETYLFEILHPYGFNIEQIETLLNPNTGDKGKRWFSKSHCIWKYGDDLILQPQQNDTPDCHIIRQTPDGLQHNCPFLHFEIQTKNGTFTPDNNVAYLDMDKLIFPLKVRYWQAGDRFVPLGMLGNKKLSDFFTDIKLNGAQKELTPLLCNGNGDILWVIGHRIDNRYRITGITARMLVIHYFKP